MQVNQSFAYYSARRFMERAGPGGVNWREIQFFASQSRYFLFPALNGRTINSGVS